MNLDQARKLGWFNPEYDRPDAGEKILLCDSTGLLCMGIYHALRDGVVDIDGKNGNRIDWSDVYEWIPYPAEI